MNLVDEAAGYQTNNGPVMRLPKKFIAICGSG